jgi:hypothetical protein
VDGLEPTQALDVVAGLFGGVASLVGALVIVLTTLILMAADAGYFSTLFAQLRPNRPLVIQQLEVFAHFVRRHMVVTTGLGII